VIVAWILLAFAVLSFIAMAIALLAVKDFYQRLHFLTPASTWGVLMIAAAVFIAESVSQTGIKAVLVGVILAATAPIISHATARAARIRQKGHWQPSPEEGFPEER